jgi:hypothetical protein
MMSGDLIPFDGDEEEEEECNKKIIMVLDTYIHKTVRLGPNLVEVYAISPMVIITRHNDDVVMEGMMNLTFLQRFVYRIRLTDTNDNNEEPTVHCVMVGSIPMSEWYSNEDAPSSTFMCPHNTCDSIEYFFGR